MYASRHPISPHLTHTSQHTHTHTSAIPWSPPPSPPPSAAPAGAAKDGLGVCVPDTCSGFPFFEKKNSNRFELPSNEKKTRARFDRVGQRPLLRRAKTRRPKPKPRRPRMIYFATHCIARGFPLRANRPAETKKGPRIFFFASACARGGSVAAGERPPHRRQAPGPERPGPGASAGAGGSGKGAAARP